MNALVELFASGGFVMPWLAVGNIVLWYALGERAWTLRPGTVRSARQTLQRLKTENARRVAVRPLIDGFARHRVLILTLTALAPLVGLLGTVTGMIETFDSLTSMSLFRGSGGVAGGISEALVSTQMGLAVAIPGLLIGRLLDRRANTLTAELEGMVA